MSEDNKKPMNPKREALIILSNKAFDFREAKVKEAKTENEMLFWSAKTLNYIMLHHFYDVDGATEFNTFNQWKELGATILKGSKAFAIWGQPLRAKSQTEEKKNLKTAEAKREDDNTDKYKYFPLCFLFSNKQILMPEERTAESQAQPEEVEQMETANLDEMF